MNDHDEKLLKEKIKENERRGRVLSLLSISFNFFSVLIVLGAGLLNEGIISLILCIFGAIILPLAGFIYAIPEKPMRSWQLRRISTEGISICS